MFLLLFQDDFLRWFIENIESDNWQDTATSWLITAIVVAVLSAIIAFGIKAFLKASAKLQVEKIWSRGKTWLLIAVGLFPLFLVLLTIWYFTRDFINFVQVGGLFKGTVFAWLLYTLLMIFGHLVSPWRRELI